MGRSVVGTPLGALHWLGGAALFALFAAVWIYFATGLPSSETLLAYQPPLPTNVRGYDGTPVQTFARERRVELSYDEFPPLLVHAFISAEDKTFFEHHGIDFTGPHQAVFNYTVKHRRRRRPRQGGSTITQQVAKYLLKDSSYNVGRKAREAILAFRLEVDAQQAADPGALPQLDLPWPQRLRRAGRGACLFRQRRE